MQGVQDMQGMQDMRGVHRMLRCPRRTPPTLAHNTPAQSSPPTPKLNPTASKVSPLRLNPSPWLTPLFLQLLPHFSSPQPTASCVKARFKRDQ